MVAQAAAAIHELQEQRALAAAVAAGEGGTAARSALATGEGGTVRRALDAQRRRVDRALAAYREGAANLAPTGDPGLDQALAAAAGRLDSLPVVRVGVDGRLVPPERVAEDHDALVAALLGATRGLAGRGRTLAERQLQLLQELAADEPAPRRRQGLLGADHLAGRLRRKAETLLAMAGPEPARPGTGPSRWPRCCGRPWPRPSPAPAATGGSTCWSPGRWRCGARPPSTWSTCWPSCSTTPPPTRPGRPHLGQRLRRRRQLPGRGQRPRPGHDRPGARLGQPAPGRPGRRRPDGVAAGDRLGLVVVAHLAARNGFGVRLARFPAGGVTAAVRLPAAALESGSPSRPASSDRPGPPALTGGFACPDRPGRCASGTSSGTVCEPHY